MAREIELTQSKVAIVDDNDYEWLNQWKWKYHKTGYAYRHEYHGKREDGSGYINKMFFMHRVIMDAPRGKVVDHINGNKLLNIRSNLRICEHRENLRNMRSDKRGSSKYKGVSFDKATNKWQAYIFYDYKKIHIGRFATEDEAGIEYNKKAVEMFGEYARLNVIGGE